MRYKSLAAWGDHLKRIHPNEIPEGYSVSRYFYYCQTGRTEGRCIQCHKPTTWNEETQKYNRYCNNPKCKEEYCKIAKQRMVDKYGKTHLLNDPQKQREMLSHRKISGEYTFQDGGKVSYVGSYEKDFLITCDYVLGLKSTDIMSPSPHNYIYMYEGKPHVYIPDFYIPNYNLEIEVKDGGDNPNNHHKIQEVDKVKEALKDQVMVKNPSVLYFKVVNKDYRDFYKFILDCKFAIDEDVKKNISSKLSAATESAGYDDLDDEVATESFLGGKIRLYHGSSLKYKILKPTAIDLGNTFSEPGWSIFTFKDYDKAYNWAASGALQSFIHIMKKKDKEFSKATSKLYWNHLVTYDAVESRAVVNQLIIPALFKLFDKYLLHFYVYTIDVDRKYVSIGNDSSLDEYSVRTDVIPSSIDKIDITKENFADIFTIVTDDKFSKILTDNKNAYGKRGFLSLFMNRDFVYHCYQSTNEAIGKLYTAVHQKKLKPGDNIMEFCEKNGIDIHKISLVDRLMMQHLVNSKLDVYSSDIGKGVVATEAALSSDERTDFGLPDKKKYPMPDAEHVKYAIKFFNYVDKEDEEELAKNINKRIKDLGVTDINVGDSNRFKKYFKPVEDAVMTGYSPIVAYEGTMGSPSSGICSLVPKKMTTKDFKNIPDTSILHMSRDAYFAKLERNPSSLRNVENYGFYNPINNALLGILTISHPNGDDSCIDLLVVAEEYRRQGLATHMLDCAVNEFGATWLIVKKSNIPAINMYKKYGFEITDTYQGKTGTVHRMEYHNSANECVSAKESTYEEANESVIFNRKDSYYNLNKWKTGKDSNILFICGHSGSGKSTLGRQISSEYNAVYIELDEYIRGEYCEPKWDPTTSNTREENLLKEFYSHPEFNFDRNKLSNASFCNSVNRAMAWLYRYASAHPGTLFVWEGVAIHNFMSFDFLKEKPVIIKGTSMLSSKIRAQKRDGSYGTSTLNEYGPEEQRISKLRKFMNSNAFVTNDYRASIHIDSTAMEGCVSLANANVERYNGKKYYPLYIVLMANKSILGDGIRAVTGEPYSHSSISFDASMQDLYTFGNKIIKKGEYTKREFGSAREAFRHDDLKFSYPPNTVSDIYVMFFNEKQINAMRKKVDDIFAHHDQYKYNISGLIKYVFGLPTKDPHKMFCSQFVTMILNEGKKGILTRDPSLYSPYGITELRGIHYVYGCTIGTYDQKIVEKKTKQIFEKIVKSGNLSALEATNSLFDNVDIDDIAMETSLTSEVKDGYKPKGHKNLSEFKTVKIDKNFIDKYKSDFKFLIHIMPSYRYQESVAWLDESNKIVGVVAVKYPKTESDSTNMIRSLEISKDYQGYGLSKQILDYAVNTLKGNTLSVAIKNKLAIKVYNDYGFVITDDSKNKVNSGKQSYYQMTLDGHEPVTESVSDFDIDDLTYYTVESVATFEQDPKYNFKTPKELIDWMKKNIKYRNYSKLMTSDEVFLKKYGSCHDQAIFIQRMLNRMGIQSNREFFIAFREGSETGGQTHTFVYFTDPDNGMVTWVENAWEDCRGVRVYKNINALRQDIFDKYKKEKESKDFPSLLFKPVSGVKPGMKLNEYVDAVLKSKSEEIILE